MTKKPYFGPDFDLFDPNVGPKKFLWVLPLLDFMHCCKLSLCAISWKSNEPSFRKRQKSSFWARLSPLDPNLDRKTVEKCLKHEIHPSII